MWMRTSSCDGSLEPQGSRFISWQLYRQAASGSRELPNVSHSPIVSERVPGGIQDEQRWEKSAMGLFPGAACLPIELPRCKAAPLQERHPLFLARPAIHGSQIFV